MKTDNHSDVFILVCPPHFVCFLYYYSIIIIIINIIRSIIINEDT